MRATLEVDPGSGKIKPFDFLFVNSSNGCVRRATKKERSMAIGRAMEAEYRDDGVRWVIASVDDPQGIISTAEVDGYLQFTSPSATLSSMSKKNVKNPRVPKIVMSQGNIEKIQKAAETFGSRKAVMEHLGMVVNSFVNDYDLSGKIFKERQA